MNNRVVITGIGAILPIGKSEDEIVKSIKDDLVSFERSKFFNDVVVTPIKDFVLSNYLQSYKYRRYLPRSWQFLVASAKIAIEDANLNKEDLSNAGLFIGVGPNIDMFEMDVNSKALGILSVLPNTPSFCISNLFGIHGENLSISTACSSSLQSIGEGFLRIKMGLLDIALCGGGDSRISKSGILLYYNAKVLNLVKEMQDPKTIYAPFDENNPGFCPGEGGAFFVLEEYNHAKKRGAKIYGEIIGYSSSLDAKNPTAPEESGIFAIRCCENAILQAKISKNDIDVIFAHGTGTPLNDIMEINLIKRIYTRKIPYVCALKSWIGHLASGCGAAEMAIGLVCINKDMLPKIRNLKTPRDRSIPFVKTNISSKIDIAIFQSFGFGGQNSCLIVKKVIT